MNGLMGTGQAFKQQSDALWQDVSRREENRNRERQQVEAAEKGQRGQMAGLGAGLGAMLASGATAGAFAGPVGMGLGALIGAGAGLLGNELF